MRSRSRGNESSGPRFDPDHPGKSLHGWGESQGLHSKGTNIDDLIARAKAQEAKDGGGDAEEI